VAGLGLGPATAAVLAGPDVTASSTSDGIMNEWTP
jgi:hypothetical protein